MADYYIPLASILGSLHLDGVPFIGDWLKGATHLIGVRQWDESWNDTHATIRGTLVWGGGDLAIEREKLRVAFFGRPVGGTSEFDFELSLARGPLLDTLLALGEESLGAGNVPTLDGRLSFLFRADGPPSDFRLVLRGAGVTLRFARDLVRKGTLVNAADGTPIGIAPITPDSTNPDADAADILLGPGVVVIDSNGLSAIELDDDQAVVAPPMLIYSGDSPLLGLLVRKLKVDFDSDRSIPEALAHGFDESWMGVYFQELAFFGLDAIFPTMPKVADPQVQGAGLVFEAKNWFIGTDGVSGSLKLALEVGPEAAEPDAEPTRENIFRGLSFELEFDRGVLVRAMGEVTLHVHKLGNEFASLGPDGTLAIGLNIRTNVDGGLLYEFLLRTPRPDNPAQDFGLLTLSDEVADVFPYVLLVIGAVANASAATEYALLVVSLFTAVDIFDWKALSLDNLKIRRRTESIDIVLPSGTPARAELRYLEFVLDFKMKVGLNFPSVGPLPRIKTDEDHPLTLLASGFTFSWMTNFREHMNDGIGDRKQFDIFFDPKSALSIEVGDQTIVKSAPFSIVKAGIGEWERGLWFDFGFKMTQDFGNFAFSVVPTVVRFYFLTSGAVDHVDFKGASFSVLVPRTIYARGEWQVGDLTRITGRALIFGWSQSLLEPTKPENWWLNVGFGIRQQDLPPPPEPKRVTSTIVSADLECSSGIPVGSMSIYGLSGLYAEHARPALGGATPAQWLTERPPQYQVDMDKWEGAEGHKGIAFGAIIGSSVDHGRPWNLKAGVLILDGFDEVMLFGTLNLLEKRKTVKDTNSAAYSFYASIDTRSKDILLGFRFDKKVPASTGSMFKVAVPLELLVNIRDWHWHFYAGQDKPPSKYISAEFLSSYTVAGYFMGDTATITNLAETGIDVPGTAFALGIRFAMEGGKKGRHYKLIYYLKAEADVALSAAEPHLSLIRAKVAGGLVAKAWGIGFEFELSADFMWVRPTPDYLQGLLKVTIDLPWPIPNLHISIPLTRGEDGDGEPITGSLIDGLSLFLLSEHRSVEVTAAAPPANVPLNPVFSLAFKYPMRNGAGVPGSFNVAGGSTTTSYYVGGDAAAPRAYVITLDELSLFKDTGGTLTLVPGPLPAFWRPDPLKAAGGNAATRILELFSYNGIGASRFIGASAEYVDWAASDLDLCPPEPVKSVCYVFDDLPLGLLAGEQRVHAPGDARALVVSAVGEAPFAESVRRYYGAVRTAIEVIETPVISSLAAHAIRLPATNGVATPITAADRLQLRFERSDEVRLFVLRYPTAVVEIRGWLGETLVVNGANGIESGPIGEDRFTFVEYVLPGPLDRIEIEVGHGVGLRLRQSLLVRACFKYSTDVRRFDDQLAASLGWSSFWSDLLSQDAAASSALLLEPGTKYALQIRTSWRHLREDGSMSDPHATMEEFSFTTVPIDQPPASLRGPASALEPGDYEVQTVPVHGQRVYADRPIRLDFADPRTDKMFGAFNQHLILRIVDEHGQDLFDRLEFLREHATELPEYQRAWRDLVLQLPCVPPGLDALWSKGVAHFSSVLDIDAKYDGALVLVPAAVTDLTAVENWDTLPTLYRFHFETSHYRTFADHVAAYAFYDEICEQPTDLAAIAAALGPLSPGEHIVDDGLLERLIADHLHLLPRNLPERPEVVRVWRLTGGGGSPVTLLALLLDDPEPFLRAGLDSLAVVSATDVILVQQQSGARTLVLFRQGTGIGSPPSGDLSVVLASSFVDANGAPATETATLLIPVPSQPPTLAAEPVP